MTEPELASSDATNIATSIVRDGDEYVINGRKFYISGACNNHTKIFIVMGKTDPDNSNKYIQQSMILVPAGTPGVNIIRPMTVYGYDDAPEGHAEMIFDNVRVPATNLLMGEGRGFEIAQGRLGPGRIHHCMRIVGLAQRALEKMCVRAETRIAFGKPLIKQQSVREDIAKSLCEIEQARLLTLKAAQKIDQGGTKAAKDLISMIKIIAPNMGCTVIDRAIQIHGAAGVSQDTFLAHAYAMARSIRLADGPDQVHMMQLGRNTAREIYANLHDKTC
jgi:acyl-CoA dehydrogenase